MFRYNHPRLYLWVRWRSVGLHLLFVAVASGCLIAAWWQIHRAAEGNTLSYLYSVEWPAFVVVAAIGWWQLVHDTDEFIASRRAYHQAVRRASAAVVARTLPRSVTALTVGSDEVSSRVLGPAERPALPGAGEAPLPAVTSAPTPVFPTGTVGDGPGEGASELDEYNQWLATLAVKGRAKTWRNPRGQ